MRFIEGGKSKRAVIISKIRGGMLTRVERRSSGPTGDLGKGGATGFKTSGSYAGDITGDELFGEVVNVEESSISLG